MTRRATPDEIADHERDLRKHDPRTPQEYADLALRLWQALRYLPPEERIGAILHELAGR